MKSILHLVIFLAFLVLASCRKDEVKTNQLSFTPSRGGLEYSSMTITGMNFSVQPGENYVEFPGGIPAIVDSATTTQLWLTVPGGATSGPILVVVNNNSHGTTGTFKVLKAVVSTFLRGTYVEHLAIDPQGNLYGDSTSNFRSTIVKVNPSGVASVFAGGVHHFPILDGQGTAASFNTTWGVAANKEGNIFVCDLHLLRKITPSALVSTLAGSGSYGFNDGSGGQAQFARLIGITVGPDNNLYVCDLPRVRKITQAGVVTTIAGLPTSGNVDGDNTVATFNAPEGIAVDVYGNIYVSDPKNYNIRKISTTGRVSTFAGSNTMQFGHADGVGTASLFVAPQAMAIDEAGNLFVSDSNYGDDYYYIRMINRTGRVTTILGGKKGSADGPAETASIFGPDGIVFDAAWNLYLADTDNSTIRKITFE